MCIILHQFGHFSDNSFQSYYPSSMLFLAELCTFSHFSNWDSQINFYQITF